MSSPEAPARPSRFGRFFWRDPNTQFLLLAAAAGLLGRLGAIAFRFLTRSLTQLLDRQRGHPPRRRAARAPRSASSLPAVGGLVGGLIARLFFMGGGTAAASPR